MVQILIIEDDNSIRDNTAELLELEGYTTIRASNGKQGLEQVGLNLPDLILCDVLMPEMDGFSVLNHLRETLAKERIPFIFFSAKSEKYEVEIGLDAGADDYLIKPFELVDLLASIEKCLSNKIQSK